MVNSLLSHWTILQSNHQTGLQKGQLLLTFDDGPNLSHRTTERALDVLEHYDTRACFCLIGEHALHAPKLVQRIHAQGHLIVNHTQSHLFSLFQSSHGLRREIRQFDQTISQILGIPQYRSHVFRPPRGLLSPTIKRIAGEEKLTLLPLTYYANDSLHGPRTAAVVIQRTLANARKQQGGIFVLHDHRRRLWRDSLRSIHDPSSGANRSWIPDAVEVILVQSRQMGLKCVDPWDLIFAPEVRTA